MLRSQSNDTNGSTSPIRVRRQRKEGHVEWESEPDSSDVEEEEEEDTVRRLRYSYSRRPNRKISVLSHVNPSPRVSMFEGPNVSMLDTPQEENQEDDLKLRKESAVRVIGALLVIVTIVQLVIIIYLLTRSASAQYCVSSSSDNVIPRDLKNPAIFDDLTLDELSEVNTFMLHNKELNLSPWDSASINSSYIYMIELFLPNKSEVLEFIDRGFARPPREAKVVVFRGNLRPSRVEEYIVSPLPNPTSCTLYRDPSFRKPVIPFSSRPNDAVEVQAAAPLIISLTERLYPILMESFGLCYHNCTIGVNCLKIFDTAPRGFASGERKTWIWFFPDIEGYYNHPLGLEVLINHESIDSTQWSVERLVYNGKAFPDVDSLIEAYWLGRVKKINNHVQANANDKTENHRPVTGHSEYKTGPRHFEPSGKRFIVSGQLITYTNWQFNFNMRPSTGLQLYNVRFAGSRIAYEISLQEVVVFYTGYGAAQGNSNFYDSSHMIGASSMELVKGIDCPEDAVYFDSYFWANSGGSKRTKNNICVFERNSELPIHRHYTDDYEGGYENYRGTPNYNLVLRTIATIWNYDYIFDYIFYNNGAIEVKVSLTGYVQSTFMLHEEQEYGNAINDHAMANLHEHVINYKVDLDIAGDLNRYRVEEIVTENVAYPWLPNVTKHQMKIKKTDVERESANETIPFKSSQYHLFHNKNAKNKYDTDQAYRILNKSPVEDLLSGSDVTNAASWSKYPIMVTRRKDGERHSSSIYAQNDPWEPVLDFDDYIDGENLVDEDIVAWVTIGTYHIPGTEDIPLTSTVWNQYSFFIAPHNYFSMSPDSNQGDTVRMRPSDGDLKNGGPIISGPHKDQTSYKCVPSPVDPTSYDGRRT